MTPEKHIRKRINQSAYQTEIVFIMSVVFITLTYRQLMVIMKYFVK